MPYDEGYDISHHNGIIRVSPMVQAEPKRKFVFIKFTEGTGWVDPRRFENIRLITQGSDFYWGPYHFFRPAWNPELQSEHFLDEVALAPYPPTLEYAVDVEAKDGLQWETVDRRLRRMLTEMMKTLEPEQIAIYTRKYFFDYVSTHEWYSQFKLWCANYRNTEPILMPTAWLKVGKSWGYWQWTSRLPGGAHGVDSKFIDGNRARSLPQVGPTLEQRVEALEREAKARGWSL